MRIFYSVVAALVMLVSSTTTFAATYKTNPEEGEVTKLNSIYFDDFEAEQITTAHEGQVLPVINAKGEEITTVTVSTSSWYGAYLKFKTTQRGNGEYNIHVPAGTFSFNGTDCADFDLCYWIGERLSYSVAPGCVDEMPTSVNVTFNFNENVTYNGTFDIYLVKDGEKLEKVSASAEGNVLTLALSKSYTDYGTYTFVIPAGALNCDGRTNSEITFEYTIMSEDMKYTITPANGSSVGYLQAISIQFNQYGYCGYDDYYKVAQIKDAEGNVVAECDYSAIKSSDNVATLSFNSLVSTPGEYTVVIPEGLIGVADAYTYSFKEHAPELTLNYTVTGEGLNSVTATPADGSVVKGVLNGLSFTFDGYSEVEVDTYAGNPTVTYPDGWGGATTSNIYSSYISAADGVVTVSQFYNPVTEPGKVTVTFPAGYFLLGAEKTPSSPVCLNYTVEHSDPVEYTVAPADGSTITSMKKVTVTFPEQYSNVKYIAGTYKTIYTWADADHTTRLGNYGEGKKYWFESDNFSTEGNTFTLELVTENPEAGEVYFTIPYGYFQLDETTLNPEITVHYTIGEAVADEYVVTPSAETTVASVKNVTIEFVNAESVALNAGIADEFEVEVKDANDEKATVVSNVRCSGNIATITLKKELTESGTYTFTLPTNYLQVTNAGEKAHACAEITVVLTVDQALAIRNAGTMTTTEAIYDLSGRFLGTNVKALSPGCYVKSGKRFIVK